jgi:hypothetical protein
MLLGAVWCPLAVVEENVKVIHDIKESWKARGELKWTKVSPSREGFFLEIVDYFFSTNNLNFRCLIVDNKAKLNHSYYNQGAHDSFYYKMYYYLLRHIMDSQKCYNVYLDIKDTRSQIKINKLRDVLCNAVHDFNRSMICKIQHVRSKEVELLQLADFLMGAISYKNRGLTSSDTKLKIVNRIVEHSNVSLEKTTPPWEEKFNLFFFSPREEKR